MKLMSRLLLAAYGVLCVAWWLWEFFGTLPALEQPLDPLSGAESAALVLWVIGATIFATFGALFGALLWLIGSRTLWMTSYVVGTVLAIAMFAAANEEPSSTVWMFLIIISLSGGAYTLLWAIAPKRFPSRNEAKKKTTDDAQRMERFNKRRSEYQRLGRSMGPPPDLD